MKEAFELFFIIMGMVATLAVFLFLIVIGLYYLACDDGPKDEYRKELCTHCGRLIPLDESVDNEGRCDECRNGVDMFV